MEKLGRRSIWLAGVAINIVVMAVIGDPFYSKAKFSLWAVAISTLVDRLHLLPSMTDKVIRTFSLHGNFYNDLH